jgi:Asp-tRNA(Asn)/Glu-tRNA(Gln) amidotransferase A subunit family amidase
VVNCPVEREHRLGYVQGVTFGREDRMPEYVQDMVDVAKKQLERLGAEVVEVTVPDWARLITFDDNAMGASAASIDARLDASQRSGRWT